MDGRLAPGAPTRWAQRVALLAHGAVIAALPVAAGPVPGAMLALPLLVALPGLWQARSYTYAWCSMLVVFYVAGFLVEAKTQPERALWLALAVVAAIEFCALVLYVRFSAVDRRRSAAAE